MLGSFLMDQILGMKWLKELAGNLLSALGIDVESPLGGGLQFFLYDVVKIAILLCVSLSRIPSRFS